MLAPVEAIDPEIARRAALAKLATGPGRTPQDIEYTADEHATWAAAHARLRPAWHEHAASMAIDGLHALALDPSKVPQLREVSERLAPRTGFRYEAVPGLVPKEEFFGALAERRFLSTQYVRSRSAPDYTPEPDVIHEVMGHAHVLTDERLAALHVQAGQALLRVETPASRQFVADVFWFSGEFGVVQEHGRWRAFGAGLLSSAGELSTFAHRARVMDLDIAAMGTLPYGISQYQPVLFGADSLQEVTDVVGGFFETCTDDTIERLRASRR